MKKILTVLLTLCLLLPLVAAAEAAFDPVGAWVMTLFKDESGEHDPAELGMDYRFVLNADGTVDIPEIPNPANGVWAFENGTLTLTNVEEESTIVFTPIADGRLLCQAGDEEIYASRDTSAVPEAAASGEGSTAQSAASGAFDPVGKWTQQKIVRKHDNAAQEGDEIPAHRRYRLTLNADGSAQIMIGDIVQNDTWSIEQVDGAPLITFAEQHLMKLTQAEDDGLVFDAGNAYVYFVRGE